MISKRTKFSLSQFLSLQEPGYVRILLNKYEIEVNGLLTQADFYTSRVIDSLGNSVQWADSEKLLYLLVEIAGTREDLRSRVTPRDKYDERWFDLARCLELDGYRIEGGNLISLEPMMAGAQAPEDALTTELNRSRLEYAADIIRLINESSEAFRRSPPDFNGCLTKVRVAIQTLATSIAKARLSAQPASFDQSKWGEVLAYLQRSGFITEKEEKGVSGAFTFVSPGAHRPVGLSEEEMARLGRSLIISMCYFLIKLHNR